MENLRTSIPLQDLLQTVTHRSASLTAAYRSGKNRMERLTRTKLLQLLSSRLPHGTSNSGIAHIRNKSVHRTTEYGRPMRRSYRKYKKYMQSEVVFNVACFVQSDALAISPEKITAACLEKYTLTISPKPLRPRQMEEGVENVRSPMLQELLHARNFHQSSCCILLYE